ncbi:hypothetical protein D3C80_387920 [compost metagenome]
MTKRVLVLDGDVIIYKCAAANEERSIKSRHIEKGVVESWSNRTEFREFLKGTNHTEDMYEVEDVQEPRHVSYGVTQVKNMVKSICDRAGVKDYIFVISGDNNFRDQILLPHEYQQDNATRSWIGGRYKSNREDSLRPIQLKALRAHAINNMGAIVVKGEADDFLTWKAYETATGKTDVEYIATTVDKDAAGPQGWWFNWDKHKAPVMIKGFGELHKEGKNVKGTGRLWLYYQSVFGDKVDGYRPVDICDILAQEQTGKKVQFGEQTALKLLQDCKNDKEAVQAVVSQYRKWYPKPVTYKAWDGQTLTKDALDIWQMYMDCAHMTRFEGDRIDVRELCKKLGVEV